MTVEEFLNQAFRLDLRIQREVEELDELKQLSRSVSSPRMGERYNATRNTDAPFVKTMEKIIELEQKVNDEVDRLVDLKAQIRETINSVPDADERLVLSCRYIKRLKWEQIAEEMSASSSTVRRWHKRAISQAVMPEKPIRI